MEPGGLLVLMILVLGIAVLYASIGHGGASGYLAAMALVSVAPDAMKPIALTLNVLVASISTVKFYRAGHFSWHVFWPFALLSAPLALVGGAVSLPGNVYRPVVGLVLLYAAYRLFQKTRSAADAETQTMPRSVALVAGAGIGLLSGLTGVGGGIFLSPILLLSRWADAPTTAAVSAAFILVNSLAGLLGHVSQEAAVPSYLPLLALAAVCGGWIGAEFGSRRASPTAIRYLLVVVLIVAGAKMLVPQ